MHNGRRWHGGSCRLYPIKNAILLGSPSSWGVRETGRSITIRRLPTTYMTVCPSVWVRLLCQSTPTWLHQRASLHIKQKPALGLVLSPLTEVKRLRQARGRMVLSLHQRPVNVAIKMSFTRWNRVLKMAKGYCKGLTSWHCLEAELKRNAKISALLPTNLATALSRISWILMSNSCTFCNRYHTPIRILYRANGINKSSSGSRNKLLHIQRDMNSCIITSLRIRKALISLFISRIQSDATQY